VCVYVYVCVCTALEETLKTVRKMYQAILFALKALGRVEGKIFPLFVADNIRCACVCVVGICEATFVFACV